MFYDILILIAGFVVLIKSADFLVEGASSIAKRWNVSDLVVGLTVVAFGTSLPELIVSVLSNVSGSSGLAIGNVLGSNIANTLLVLGVCAIIYPLAVKSSTIYREIPFSLGAVIVLAVLANDILIDRSGVSMLSRIDGVILLLLFVLYMYYVFMMAKNGGNDAEHFEIESYPKSISLIVLGIIGLFVGGKLLVDSAVSISHALGISEAIIGLTVVAIGTSLPELVTSVVAAFKKNSNIAVGNIIGSNIFNIFWILGLSAVVRPLVFDAASNVDIFMILFSTLLLMLFMFQGEKQTLNKWKGVTFLVIYFVYIMYLIFFR